MNQDVITGEDFFCVLILANYWKTNIFTSSETRNDIIRLIKHEAVKKIYTLICAL